MALYSLHRRELARAQCDECVSFFANVPVRRGLSTCGSISRMSIADCRLYPPAVVTAGPHALSTSAAVSASRRGCRLMLAYVSAM